LSVCTEAVGTEISGQAPDDTAGCVCIERVGTVSIGDEALLSPLSTEWRGVGGEADICSGVGTEIPIASFFKGEISNISTCSGVGIEISGQARDDTAGDIYTLSVFFFGVSHP
jgi:hypothetical protein